MDEHVSLWMDIEDVPVRLHYVDVDGVRTRVLEAGEGTPLVLVHGTGGHLEAYSRNLRGLSKHFRVIAHDMIGHGRTDKPDLPYTTDVLSNHLVGLLDALDIERAHLSGESLGGWVTAWTAAHHPERVDRLILNTPGNITNKPEVMKQVRVSTLKAVREASYENVKTRLEWLFHDKSFVTEELIELRYRLYTQPGIERAMENVLVLQDWEIRKPYAWSPDWCDKIVAPTLLLWTDNDPTGTLEEADLLNKWIPNSQLRVIKGAGHWPQWEKPDEFNTLHTDFIQEREI